MKIVFLGATKFSEEILVYLLDQKIDISLIFTIPSEFGISYSETKVKNYNYSNLEQIANKYRIPTLLVDSSEQGKKLADYYNVLAELKPDIILVMGWYYMVPLKIRNLARYGAWGIHASYLPNYAGGAPLVWAIINGETETGVTLFKLDEGVDDGDIIMQRKIQIAYMDSIREVYDKVTVVSKQILLDSLLNIDNIVFTPQNKEEIRVYPQRKPEDGELDLSKSALELYNFIRAQSSPYPGAFIKTCDGKKLIIEKARIE